MILLVSLMGTYSCTNTTEELNDEGETRTELRSASTLEESDLPTLFNFGFPNISFTEYWIETIDNEVQYFAKGIDSDGNSTEARIKGGGAETCTGVGCSYCKIDTYNGGCKCKRKATTDGYCNHSVSSIGFNDYLESK